MWTLTSSLTAIAVEKSSLAGSCVLDYGPTSWKSPPHWASFKSLIAHSHRYQGSSIPLLLQLCRKLFTLGHHHFFFVWKQMLESFGSWQYGISDPLLVQNRSVWCGKEVCQGAGRWSSCYYYESSLSVLVGRNNVPKNPADFQTQHFPTAWGPPMGFHNGFTVCLMKRLMKI